VLGVSAVRRVHLFDGDFAVQLEIFGDVDFAESAAGVAAEYAETPGGRGRGRSRRGGALARCRPPDECRMLRMVGFQRRERRVQVRVVEGAQLVLHRRQRRQTRQTAIKAVLVRLEMLRGQALEQAEARSGERALVDENIAQALPLVLHPGAYRAEQRGAAYKIHLQRQQADENLLASRSGWGGRSEHKQSTKQIRALLFEQTL